MLFNKNLFISYYFWSPMGIISNGSIPDGKYLGTISSDFIKVSNILQESSYQIRKAGFAYPLFPICKDLISIGSVLIEQNTLGVIWNYYASFLDEFVQRGLVDRGKEDAFKQVYKNPDEFCCLFVVDTEFTQFLHIPYPVD